VGERWLVAERDRDNPLVWWYGLADSPTGPLPGGALRYHHDPATMVGKPIDDPSDLYPTVALLVRMAGGRRRLTWDLTYRPLEQLPRPPTPPPGSPERRMRATGGKAKGGGETLARRAERARRQTPEAAA
jgi:hypothetical protein